MSAWSPTCSDHGPVEAKSYSSLRAKSTYWWPRPARVLWRISRSRRWRASALLLAPALASRPTAPRATTSPTLTSSGAKRRSKAIPVSRSCSGIGRWEAPLRQSWPYVGVGGSDLGHTAYRAWAMTLFVHETHHVRGRAADAFEAAYRDEWMPALAAGDDARLLWYCHHAHGSGPAYQVVTVTGVHDGAASERLVRRLVDGD